MSPVRWKYRYEPPRDSTITTFRRPSLHTRSNIQTKLRVETSIIKSIRKWFQSPKYNKKLIFCCVQTIANDKLFAIFKQFSTGLSHILKYKSLFTEIIFINWKTHFQNRNLQFDAVDYHRYVYVCVRVKFAWNNKISWNYDWIEYLYASVRVYVPSYCFFFFFLN